MTRLLLLAGIAGCVCAAASAQNEQPKATDIPLKEIWALGMPGTFNLANIEDVVASKEIQSIRRSLSMPVAQDSRGKTGFVVLGTSVTALHEAHAILVDGKKPREVFPHNCDLCAVFFSREFGRYVQIRRITSCGNLITIHYEFVPHKTKELSTHFALVPLGKLLPGKKQVTIAQVPLSAELSSAGWKPICLDVSQQIVCKSFSFVVE